MRREGTAALAVALTAIAVGPGAADAAPAKQKAPKPPTTTAGFAKQLVKDTGKLPKGADRTRLLVLANRVKQQQGSNPCGAIGNVQLYRARIKKLPKAQGKKALVVDAEALTIYQRLLRSKRAAKCGGGVTPATVETASPSLLKSDTSGVSLKVALPELGVSTKSKGGKLWTELGAEGTDSPQVPGQPAIPTASFTVAVPEGATLETQSSDGGGSYALDGVDVLPAQPDTADTAEPSTTRPDFTKAPFADAKFVPPGPAYKTDAFPAKPADASVDGVAHGIRIATIQIPLATYQPKKKKLIVHRSVNVNINFKGGNGFGGDGGPWDKFGLSLSSGLLNSAAIREQWIKNPYFPHSCGEEFLIVTSATTRAAADALAVSRNAAGIKTRVVQTGGGAGEIGTTNTQIQTYIRNEQKRLLCVHPSYLLLMGNEELVPTFEISGATSDLPYATIDDTDTLPDIASGRIPGKDAAQVQTVVDKIIGYETNPLPAGAGTRAMVAGEFQDDDGDGQEDRTFIQFAETVAEGLEHRGVSVTRVYNDQGNTTPARFNDGSPLPAALLPASNWDGTGAEIKTAINNNVFLAIHRDHGWSQGWATPGFTSSDLNTLTNTALPVILSVNCSSGAYDRDDASFATTALVKPGAGGVAVFGDTEDSPSWHNSQLAFGFVDAMLPSVLPGEGPSQPQRLGDALVWGKNRLQGLAPAPGDGNTTFEHRIWHLYGDPTMRMRGGSSLRYDLSQLAIKFLYTKEKPGPPPVETNPQYKVELAGLPGELTGQVFSLLKGTEVVGQGLIHDGVATIPAVFGDGSVKPGELKLVLDAPTDAGPQTFGVDSSKAETSLNQTCPAGSAFDTPLTVNGQLLGAPAGQTVKVTFQPPTPNANVAAPVTPAPVVVTATTDENGNYSASVTPVRAQQGTWSVKSSYAGDDAHTGSDSTSCAVKVGATAGAVR